MVIVKFLRQGLTNRQARKDYLELLGLLGVAWSRHNPTLLNQVVYWCQHG